MNARKTISALLVSALLLCAVCTACGEAEAPDYYHIGLEVTGLMGEIVDSEDYLSMLSLPQSFSEIRERVNMHDYHRPAAVYSLSLSDPKAFMEELMRDDRESREKYDRLSPALQDQLLTRLSLPALCTRINARSGPEYLALFSITNAVVRNDALTAEKACYYLYFFEMGAPVLVSFGYHSAAGQFLDVPVEYRNSPADIKAYLNLPGLDVIPVNTGESAAVPSGNLADYGIDPEEALRKMRQSVGEHIPTSGRFFSDRYKLFDITGDGCTDLCTCVTWGSGMVRTDLVVYDPVHEDLYVLDGYNYDYLIDRVEEDRIVIVKEGPHGYNDPVTKTCGTVKLESRQLIFIPDSEEH